MIIKSNKIDISNNLYNNIYEIEKKGESKEINEPLISNETIANTRAVAEFLEYGYDKQTVEFTTYFAPLKINSIISIYAPDYRIPKDLTKDRFIVRKLTHLFKNGVVKTKVKAVRYDKWT